jgi:hypothetical protein
LGVVNEIIPRPGDINGVQSATTRLFLFIIPWIEPFSDHLKIAQPYFSVDFYFYLL